MARYVTWVNVLDTFPGKGGKGDTFPQPQARRRAARMPLTPVTLVLGQQVAHAFRLAPIYFQWQDLRGRRVAVIPHPSGINRWDNDPVNVTQAQRFLRHLFQLVLRNMNAATKEPHAAMPPVRE